MLSQALIQQKPNARYIHQQFILRPVVHGKHIWDGLQIQQLKDN